MSNFILSLFIHHPCLVLEPDSVTPGGVRGFHSPVSLLHQALQFKVPTVVSQWSLQRLFPSDRTLSQGLAALGDTQEVQGCFCITDTSTALQSFCLPMDTTVPLRLA